MLEQFAALTQWPYFIWAAAAATSFYGATIWAVSHLHPDKKAHLSLWLQGDYNSTWTAQFCAMFDQLFGAKHLGWRCFTRSAIASVVAVFALWLLFDQILGLISLRADTGLTLTQALLLGAAINIIPDYLSLFETRWLLQQFERVRHPLGQIAVLLLDAVVTGLIIYCGITVYLWATGQKPITFIEMMALFSIYAVFFYSTFLTSFWAWAYCISSWVARLSGRLRGWLNMQQQPGRSLALIGGTLVLIAGMALKPALTMDEDGRITFDDFLCDTFPGSACTHVARLTADEEEKLAYLGKACLGGVTEECLDVGLAIYQINPTETAAIWDKSCSSGNPSGCANLGYLYEKAFGVALDYDRARELYTRGCDGGDAYGCMSLGVLYGNGIGIAQDYDKANEFLTLACDGGNADGCSNLGILYTDALGVDQDYARAKDLYAEGCAGGSARGCTNLGYLYEIGNGVGQDLNRARALYERGCSGGNVVGCINLANYYRDASGVEQDYVRAKDLYTQGCDGGVAQGCTLLGWMHQNGWGVPRSVDTANIHYQQACDMGDKWACEKLAIDDLRASD